jgi:hypothetical protein
VHAIQLRREDFEKGERIMPKVYVSVAPQDFERCKPLLAALKSWSMGYWVETEDASGQAISSRGRQALGTHDFLLRICTPALQATPRCRQELDLFRELHPQNGEGAQAPRRIINLILDAAYAAEPNDVEAARINGSVQPMAFWLPALRQAIKPFEPARREMERWQLTLFVGIGVFIGFILMTVSVWYTASHWNELRGPGIAPSPTSTPEGIIAPMPGHTMFVVGEVVPIAV